MRKQPGTVAEQFGGRAEGLMEIDVWSAARPTGPVRSPRARGAPAPRRARSPSAPHDGEPITANDPAGRASSPADRFGVRGSPGSLQPEQGTAGHEYGCTSSARLIGHFCDHCGPGSDPGRSIALGWCSRRSRRVTVPAWSGPARSGGMSRRVGKRSAREAVDEVHVSVRAWPWSAWRALRARVAFALRAAFVSMWVRTAMGRAIRDPGRPGVRPCCCVGRRRRSGVGRLGPRQLWFRDHTTWSSYQRTALTPCHEAASSTWSSYQRAALTPRHEAASPSWSAART